MTSATGSPGTSPERHRPQLLGDAQGLGRGCGHLIGATVQRCNGATVQRCNGATPARQDGAWYKILRKSYFQTSETVIHIDTY